MSVAKNKENYVFMIEINMKVRVKYGENDFCVFCILYFILISRNKNFEPDVKGFYRD